MGGSDVHPCHHEGSELSPLTEALCAALYICFAPGNFLLKHFPMTPSALTAQCPWPDLAAIIRWLHGVLGPFLCISMLTYLMTL